MKIDLKVSFWEQIDPEKVSKIIILYMIIAIAMVLVGLWNVNWAMIIIGGIQYLFSMMMDRSYVKWKKKQAKEKIHQVKVKVMPRE